MMKKALTLICCAIMVMTLSSKTASAATVVVDQGGAGDYLTVADAIAGATSGDTIVINAGTYSGDRMDLGSKPLTIETAPGADVVIDSVSNTVLVLAGQQTTVRGTADHPLVLRRSDNGEPMVDHAGISANYTFEYVTFEYEGWRMFNLGGGNSGEIVTFNNCDILTTATGPAVMLLWDNISIEMNDCSVDVVGNEQFLRSSSGGTFVMNRCDVVGHGTGSFGETSDAALQWGNSYGVGGWQSKVQSMTITDCTFSNYVWVYSQWDGSIDAATEGPLKTITLVNTKTAQNTVCGLAQINNNETVTIKGKSATEKCAYDGSTNTFFAPIRVREGGNLLIEDCTLRGGAWNNVLMEVNAQMPMDSTITFNRCRLSDDVCASKIVSADLGGDSSGTVNLTMTNCIMEFVDGMVSLTGAAAVNMTLEHCTVMQDAAGTGTAVTLASAGTLTANYSIFSAAGNSVFCSKEIGGTLNAVNHPDGASYAGTLAGDTLFLDPQLDATGHISGVSLVGDKAVGSALTVDYDGDARPLGATNPDLGADENYSVPVTLSSFSLDN